MRLWFNILVVVVNILSLTFLSTAMIIFIVMADMKPSEIYIYHIAHFAVFLVVGMWGAIHSMRMVHYAAMLKEVD